MLLADSSSGSGFSGWAIVSAVAAYILQQVWSTSVRKRRLRSAVIVDCLETLNRLSEQYSGFNCNRPEGLTSEDDFAAARSHCNGFVVTGAMPETKELITLLDQKEARLLVWYFERWDLFKNLEERYAVTYQRLLEAAAKCCEPNSEVEKRLKEEYWQQLRVSLDQMRETGRELCLFACRLFRAIAPTNELELEENSDGRWKEWADFEKERKRFER